MKLKKILLLSANQYGHFIDHYYLSSELSAYCEVDVISMYEGKSVIPEKDKVNVVQLLFSTKFSRAFSFRRYLKTIKNKKYDLVIASYFRGICFCASELKRIADVCYFDVRSIDVSRNQIKRLLFNKLILLESTFFIKHSVISKGVAEYLGLKNAFLLPLGCNPQEYKSKLTGTNLLYVGTLNGRDIYKTVEAIAQLPVSYRSQIRYYIVGSGSQTETDRIKKTIEEHALSGMVFLVGYVPTADLYQYYEKSNVGISFVPINDIYTLQPPTKTLEYLAAGLPVLATSTKANLEILDESCAFMVNDSAEDFARGLLLMVDNFDQFQADKIRSKVRDYTWNSIAQSVLELN